MNHPPSAKLTGIKVIIWDFDNTLYRAIPALSDEVRQAEVSVIRAHTGWDYDEALRQFSSLYHRIYFSATQVSAHLAGISVLEASREMETIINRDKYLKPDVKLQKMFASLSAYRHIILTNGLTKAVQSSLSILGVSPAIFEFIASSELTGVNKPDPRAYEYVLSQTRLPPGAHLMVGDRDEIDIAPAELFGIHTCFVWGVSDVAEYSLPVVYDVPTILN